MENRFFFSSFPPKQIESVYIKEKRMKTGGKPESANVAYASVFLVST